MELKEDFSDGDVLYSKTTSDPDGLNGITNEINKGIVPIGSYFGMISLGFGTNTSVNTNKLINTAANFTSTYLNKYVFIGNHYDSDTYTNSTGNTWQLSKTWTFDAGGTKGVKLNTITNEFRNTQTVYSAQCYYKFYYTDSTSNNSGVAWRGSNNTWISETFQNPNPTKLIHKIELYLYGDTVGRGSARYHRFYLLGSALVTNIDSTTQITIDTDLFIYTGASYSFFNFMPGYYELCDGATVQNTLSPLYGITKPNIANTYVRVI